MDDQEDGRQNGFCSLGKFGKFCRFFFASFPPVLGFMGIWKGAPTHQRVLAANSLPDESQLMDGTEIYSPCHHNLMPFFIFSFSTFVPSGSNDKLAVLLSTLRVLMVT